MVTSKINNNYAACLSAGCKGFTSHGSGFCEACRKKTCTECGAKFTAKLTRAIINKALCGNCLKKKNERMKRNG